MRARGPVLAFLAAIATTAPGYGGSVFNIPQNGAPLSFGMTPDEACGALGVPLHRVRGCCGNELFAALPNVKGSVLAQRSDALYLQFRKGRLTGWKGDWGTIRP